MCLAASSSFLALLPCVACHDLCLARVTIWPSTCVFSAPASAAQAQLNARYVPVIYTIVQHVYIRVYRVYSVLVLAWCICNLSKLQANFSLTLKQHAKDIRATMNWSKSAVAVIWPKSFAVAASQPSSWSGAKTQSVITWSTTERERGRDGESDKTFD